MTDEVVDELEWLERWYRSKCDGVWEHNGGVSIESCDNPGWWVRIDLDDKDSAPSEGVVLGTVGEPPSAENGNIGGDEWMLCQVKDSRFDGAGDAGKLRAIIRCFRDMIVEPGGDRRF